MHLFNLCQASLGSHEGVVRGRVVYLSPPDDPLAPVTAGTAVIHTGEFLGQRVEFDRSVCAAYGFSLAKANLSHIITSGKKFPEFVAHSNTFFIFFFLFMYSLLFDHEQTFNWALDNNFHCVLCVNSRILGITNNLVFISEYSVL